MRVRDLVAALHLRTHAGEANLDREVTGGFVGDLMSEAIARAPAGAVWVTVQCHVNVVAVAVMKELAAAIVAGGKRPEEEALLRAAKEGVPLLSSDLSAYEIVGRLYALGVAERSKDARGV